MIYVCMPLNLRPSVHFALLPCSRTVNCTYFPGLNMAEFVSRHGIIFCRASTWQRMLSCTGLWDPIRPQPCSESLRCLSLVRASMPCSFPILCRTAAQEFKSESQETLVYTPLRHINWWSSAFLNWAVQKLWGAVLIWHRTYMWYRVQSLHFIWTLLPYWGPSFSPG